MIKTVVLSLLSCFTAFTSTLLACDCNGQSTVEARLKQADIVVEGKVTSFIIIILTDSSSQLTYGTDSSLHHVNHTKMLFAYDVKVSAVIKGKRQMKRMTILSGVGPGDCGFRFAVGNNYVIYGSVNTYFDAQSTQASYTHIPGQEVYWTNRCSGTQLFTKEEHKALQKAYEAQ